MSTQMEFSEPCSRCGKPVPWGKGCACSTGKVEVDRLIQQAEAESKAIDRIVEECMSGPPWTGTCASCGKKAVSYKHGGAPDSYELSCDSCGAFYDED